MNLTENKFLLLYSFCKVVEGESRSVITNLQKGTLKFIPNEMGEIIKMLKVESIDNVRNKFSDQLTVFDSYITFLIENKFAHFTNSNKEFTDISNSWSSPELINNATIEYNFDNYNLLDVCRQLNGINTKFIELRLLSFIQINTSELLKVLRYLSSSTIRSLRLFIPYTDDAEEFIHEIHRLYPIIDCVFFYNCTKSKTVEKDTAQLFYIKQNIEEIKHSNINRKFLINNIDFFYECQKHNPYYNKKVSISSKGEIKNCLKNKKIFGTIEKQQIADLVSTDQFQEFWYVTHDQIEGVSQSELRYNVIITNDLEKIADGKYKIIV